MNSNNCSGQNVSINVNLSLKNETLRMLIEMANDMGASLEDVISSVTEDSVIDLERLQDDLDIVIIPGKCSKQDLINLIQ
ncbi:CopG family transcriptional regulator [Prochlorococcus marinus]|uniref:CopG family transcriptional regulator n=1 Tax=Prochlorococcus marinus TaxID=1219 RepID=UPI0022B4C9A8|nr:CopG family transcriptional regulator [Prochlorococcus marinus]